MLSPWWCLYSEMTLLLKEKYLSKSTFIYTCSFQASTLKVTTADNKKRMTWHFLSFLSHTAPYFREKILNEPLYHSCLGTDILLKCLLGKNLQDKKCHLTLGYAGLTALWFRERS